MVKPTPTQLEGVAIGRETGVAVGSDLTHKAPIAREAGFDVEKYAQRLDPAHEALTALSVSSETLKAFKAGYATAGVHRGRLALPIHDCNGACIAYFGRSLKEESPLLLFPNGVNPSEHIFGAHQVEPGELYLVRDPLQVLTASENGVTNVVSFLAPITPQMLEMLAALCDEKKVESIELF